MNAFQFLFESNEGILFGKDFFADKIELCNTVGTMCIVGCAASLFSMVLLAFNRFDYCLSLTFGLLYFQLILKKQCFKYNIYRYIFILYRDFYDGIFSKKRLVAYCLSAWAFGVLLDLPNYLGIKQFYSLKFWNRNL